MIFLLNKSTAVDLTVKHLGGDRMQMQITTQCLDTPLSADNMLTIVLPRQQMFELGAYIRSVAGEPRHENA